MSVFGFSFLPFDWEIRKTIWKTVLKNSGLARARIISKKKTTVHENSFSNPFSDFPIERWKGNQWNPDLDFLTEIHLEDGFLVRLQNPKSGFQNLNPDLPIERKPKYLCTYQRPSWEVDIREPRRAFAQRIRSLRIESPSSKNNLSPQKATIAPTDKWQLKSEAIKTKVSVNLFLKNKLKGCKWHGFKIR